MERLRNQLSQVTANVERAEQLGFPIWPLNEADTERLVVEPLLHALGYGELDFRKRVHGIGANYPDYIVLPGSDQQWILEAKEWDARLDERGERQTVNYANNNGAQWAVLTNGRTWWVYNTRVPADLTQQRVYELPDVLDTDKAVEILSYLSRDSIQGGELDRAYRGREIRAALIAELNAGNRQIVKVMQSVIGRNLDKHVSNEDIVEALRGLVPTTPSVVRTSTPVDAPITAVETDGVQHDGLVSILQLLDSPDMFKGCRPLSVSAFGSEETTESWRDVVLFVIQNSAVLPNITIPFRAGPRAKRYFLNAEPKHGDGKRMKAPRPVSCGTISVFVELHYSAHNLLTVLASLIRSAGLDPGGVMLRIAASEPSAE